MPEGPEVWILSQAINAYYNYEKTMPYAKHLIVRHDNTSGEDFSFGLTGRVKILGNGDLVKINSGWLYGDEIRVEDMTAYLKEHFTAIDWLTCSEEDLRGEVDSWIKSKKKLGGLLLDQTKIGGIGVAWGSEILFKAELRPDMRACDQVLKSLADCMIEIREKVKTEYLAYLETCVNDDGKKEFINSWFENLYEIREMQVYKKGSKVEVLGRSWWV